MKCLYPVLIKKPEPWWKSNTRHGDVYMYVPCGQCMECRIARRSEWMTRIMHELDAHQGIGTFITLTYDDEYLAENSLQKADLVNFWKRLRKYYEPKKIRYYACGEYGEKNKRPHYHAIIFGLSLVDLEVVYKNKNMISPILNKIWTYGYNVCGTVTTDSAQYVAGYIEKKLTGEAGKNEYENRGVIAPYSVCSQGIGKNYVVKNGEQIRENLGITIKGKQVGIPRYYKKILKINPEKLKKLTVEKTEKLKKLYEITYKTGGDIATDKLRSDIATHRLEALKTRMSIKTRTLEKYSGSIDPESPSEAR